MNRVGLECKKPEGAFYVFPSIKKTGFDCLEFAQRLLREQKVAVVPGTAFGPSTTLRANGERSRTIGKDFKDYVRISYASSLENIKEALSRIEKFLDNIKK